MSTILKALQRVEGERPAGAPAPTRRAVRGDFVAERGKPLLRRSRRSGPSRLIWSCLGAALLVAVLVWWRLPDRGDTGDRAEGEARVASRTEPEAGRTERAETADTPSPPAERATAPPAGSPPAPQERTAASSGGPPVEPAAPFERAEAPPVQEPAPPAAPPVAAAPQEPAVPPPPAVPPDIAERLPPLGVTLDAPAPDPVAPAAAEAQAGPSALGAAGGAAAEPPEPASEPPLAVARPPTTARVEPPTAAPKAAPAPPRRASVAKPPLPREPKAPSVLVERTSWHPSAERRVAWVSVEGFGGSRELREGEAVGALVVKEIRPSSVVFLHGADTLQRRVGERR